MAIRASVAMAAYNGEKYIGEQIETVLSALSSEDELVISCDPSTDNTDRIIDGYCIGDPRIKKVVNTGKHGVVSNFCSAISHCKGDYIFLCDQDDIWIKDKVDKVIRKFQIEHACLVIHDANIIDANGKSLEGTLFSLSHISISPFRNYYKGTYWGCCMAFRADLMPIILPIDDRLRHDLWIGILTGTIGGKIVIINEKLIGHRVHGENFTTGHRRSIIDVILDRLRLGIQIFGRVFRTRKYRQDIFI